MKYLVSLLLLSSLALVYFGMSVPADMDDGPGKSVSRVSLDLPRTESGHWLLDSPPSSFQSLTRKALFNPDRQVEKPRRKVVSQAAPRKQERLELQALGIAVSDEGFLAVVKERRSGEIRRMRIDEEINGWSLESINREGFTYSKAERQIFIPFKQQQEAAGHE